MYPKFNNHNKAMINCNNDYIRITNILPASIESKLKKLCLSRAETVMVAMLLLHL